MKIDLRELFNEIEVSSRVTTDALHGRNTASSPVYSSTLRALMLC